MRFLRFSLIVMLIAAAPAAVALEIGKPAPAFEIVSADGQVFTSSEARGEVLVIHFWATWCSYCRVEMPVLETYYHRHKAEGLRMIAVNMDVADADAQASEIMRSYSYAAGIGHLSKLRGYGRIWRLPMTFVVDRNGILRRDGSVGEPGIDLATLEREVTPLLTAKRP
jgi:peroxiredoxin